ncbi:MAG: guanylate kinase [Rhodothermales bacterium]
MKIIVLTAPSGAGKTTIAQRVLEAIPEIRFSVSATTRPARPHEQDGIDYHFVSPEEFEALIAEGELLEYEEVYPGRFYGTLRAEVDRLAEEVPVLLDVEVKGALNVKRLFGDNALVLFIRPPSLEALEARLQARGTETSATLRTRLERARKEIAFADRFDATIVNDRLEEAVEETLRAVRSFLAS